MRLREFRRADGPGFFELLKAQFPEEERMYGTRPEGFERLLRRLYRADFRFFLGLLRTFHRSPFHLYVIDDGGRVVGVTMLSFAARAGYLSTVVVAPEYRRRGLARQLIDAARKESARRRKPYVALRVLATNDPARALYASAGYRELDRQTFAVHDDPASFAGERPDGGIRAFRRADGDALAEIANRTSSAAVREVLPVRGPDLAPQRWADRLFEAESAAWVVDRGSGPEAYLAATMSPLTAAAHVSTPIVSESVEPALSTRLVRVAGAWLAPRRPARIVTSVPDENQRGRAALAEGGFHEEIAHYTLYRSSS